MIEIIKRGTKKTCTCDNCGCFFSYEKEDIEYKNHAKPLWGARIVYSTTDFIKCPQCDTEIILRQTK